MNPKSHFVCLMAATLLICHLNSFADDDNVGINDKYFEFNENKEENLIKKYTEVGLAFSYMTSTNDVKDGLGGQLIIDINKYDPIIPRFGFHILWSRIEDEIIKNEKFYSVGCDIDLLLRKTTRGIRPYLGAGMSIYYNQWPAGEFKEIDTVNFTSYTTNKFHDYGSGININVRGGVYLDISDKLSILADILYLPAAPKYDVIYYSFFPYRETNGTEEYDMNVYVLSIGMVVDL